MKQVERYFYPAVFSYAPDQEIAVTFPDLDVATSGTDDTDALLSARELLGCVLWRTGGGRRGYPRPHPSGRCKAGRTANGPSLWMCICPPVRLARVNRSVNRTVTLPAWLNAAALERNVNFSQVLQDALRTQLHLG